MTEKALQKVSGVLVVSAVSMLVLFLVLATTYALYLFVKATKLPDVAGLHFSKNISLQVKSMEGELYTDKDKGIENWLIAESEQNGFQIKYPNDWEKQRTENGIILKVYNKERSGMESLAMTVTAERKKEMDEKVLQKMLQDKGFTWQAQWTQLLTSDGGSVRTVTEKCKDGFYHEIVLWRSGKDAVLLEGMFYNENRGVLQKDFDKVVAEFKLI